MDVLSALLRLRGVVTGVDILGPGSGVVIRRIMFRRTSGDNLKTKLSLYGKIRIKVSGA